MPDGGILLGFLPGPTRARAKTKPWRLPHMPSQEYHDTVKVLAANGVSAETIRLSLHLDHKTFDKHYAADALAENAREEITIALKTSTLWRALEGDWRCALSWLARFGGPEWKLPKRHVHAGLNEIAIAPKARVTTQLAGGADGGHAADPRSRARGQ
jgi:hypothetical protein